MPYTTSKSTLGVALTCPSSGLCDNVHEVPTCQATQQNENAEGKFRLYTAMTLSADQVMGKIGVPTEEQPS